MHEAAPGWGGTAGLPEEHLSRLCRVHLGRILDEPDGNPPEQAVSLALALRFIETHAREGRISGAPSAALANRPRFTEFLTRLLGPSCPDPACAFRKRCDVHRPFAVEILQRNFDLSAFRPHQEENIHALLGDASPLLVMPTGAGKSPCYQLPAVHGGERLRGLTVVVSPLQALMPTRSAGFPHATRQPATSTRASRG